MCDEFMVCGCMQVSSDNVLNRAVCGEESRVMFIEGVPTTALWDCFCCEAIKKEKPNKVQCDADEIDIYLQQEASPFCVAKPLQVRMALATEIVICINIFSSPFVLSEPFSLQDGGWTMQTRMGASLRETDEDDVYGYVLP